MKQVNRNSFLALFSDIEMTGFVSQLNDGFYLEEIDRELEYRRQNGIVIKTTNKQEVLKCLDELAQTVVRTKFV